MSRPLALVVVLLLPGCRGGEPSVGRSDPPGCPAVAHPEAAEGWTAYRTADLDGAQLHFQAARDLCPSHVGARVGLGYVALRSDLDEVAHALFAGVLEDDAANVDALAGLGLLAWRGGRMEEARERFQAVLAFSPEHLEARSYLARIDSATVTKR